MSVLFQNHFSFVTGGLESELSFDSKDSEISFDRARSTTVNSLTLRAICNISSYDGEDLFADELLVH